MRVFFIFLVLVFSGCFDRSTFVSTRVATPENTSLIGVNKNNPIIKPKRGEKPFFIPQNSNQKRDFYSNQTQNVRELVGYIANSSYDSDMNLYSYTLVNALRTKSIMFFANKKLFYPPNKLVIVKLRNNYLESIKLYYPVVKKRKKSWIGAAKEYFIKVK